MQKTIYKIGVFGSGDNFSEEIAKEAFKVGVEIARSGHVFISGACSGLPGAAYQGAKGAGGRTVNFSPARNLKEHREVYHLPFYPNEDIIYTNSNFTYRDVANVSACDAGIIIGGMSGTLHELALSFEADLVVGVLKHSGGIADMALCLANQVRKPYSKYIVFEESDPTLLVQRVISLLDTRQQEC